MEGRSHSGDWLLWHVGEFLWNYFMVECHLEPQECIRLWHNRQGKLVAYAMLGEDPLFDCQVLPGYAWQGIEEEALGWVEEQLARRRLENPAAWGGSLVSGARADDPDRIAFLERCGFRRGGQFSEVNMLRSLEEPLPPVVLPPGYRVRSITEDEITPRAAMQHAVWQPWSVGNVTSAHYARFMQLPGYVRELDLVTIAPDGTFAAYMNGWLDPVNGIGDIGPVGALPAFRQKGLTRAALLTGIHRMQALGMQRVCISTGVSNIPAIRLYESLGFKIVNQYFEYLKPA